MGKQVIVPPMARFLINEILSASGELVLRIGLQEYTVHHPGGAITEHKQTTSIMLVDGTVWAPSSGANAVPVGVCEICRHPPVSILHPAKPMHGLCSMQAARSCSGCGTLTCPKHRSFVDGGWWCPACKRAYKRNKLIKSVFYVREAE